MTMLDEGTRSSARPETGGERFSTGDDGVDRSQLSRSRRLVRSLLNRAGDPPIKMVLWNGEEISTSAQPPIARIKIADRVTMLKLVINPDLEFGDAYSSGRVSVDGDLTQLVAA